MQTNRMVRSAGLLLLWIYFLTGTSLQAQGTESWWPHPIWGAEDQAGGSNWMTPEKVLEALSIIKTGKTYELGFMYKNEMPLPGNREYELTIPPTMGPFGEEGMMGHQENFKANIGHVGTQFDGLGHIGKRVSDGAGKTQDVFYNGFKVDEVYSPTGLKKLGVENVKPIITRGILIDIAGHKNMPTLPDGYVVTLEEVKAALKAQNIDEARIKPGDAILFNFGWWRIIGEPERYGSFNWPGIDESVVSWIIEKKAVMIGSDSSGDPQGQGHLSVHFDLLMKNGIYNLEFMTFERILEDQVYEFLFILTPLRLKGATGSPVRPIAIH